MAAIGVTFDSTGGSLIRCAAGLASWSPIQLVSALATVEAGRFVTSVAQQQDTFKNLDTTTENNDSRPMV